jgi:hypothetical protein
MVETLIRTQGCYVGIFDLASRAHKEESFDKLIGRAKADATNDNKAWTTLFYLNDGLLLRMRRGEILAWTLFWDGCFKARIRTHSSDESAPIKCKGSAFLNGEHYDLICPTGRIAVASLHELGTPDLHPILEVAPGTYRVDFAEDDEEVNKHYEFDGQIDYPADDGPDWVLTLTRIS